MKRTLRIVVSLFSVLVLAAGVSLAQAPTGGISGTITDQSGGVIPNATITVTNPDTGLTRDLSSGAVGIYNAASLPAGNYRVKVEAAGFKTRERMASVVVGSTTIVDFQMDVGAPTEMVTVAEAAPLLDTEAHKIDGVVSGSQIQDLPLNGRSFLQLASLLPGVTVSANNLGQYNRQFDVNILGSNNERVRITVDGSTVNDSVTGGTQQNFSQEVIQEFQVSAVNFDLSTGITGGGAINVVTRSGSNDFHGSGFFYFRDHNMSAFPYLKRPTQQDIALFGNRARDPFFARRQPGFSVGGPVQKDKLFFFTAYEHFNQQGVFSAQPLNSPQFAKFATNFGSPYVGNQFTSRLDYRINEKHSSFLRYSHDGNHSFAPRTTNSLPSNWVKNKNFADSGVFSLTSSFRPTMVNEFRYSMTYWSNKNDPPSPEDCPNCPGLGGPEIRIVGISGFYFGNTTNAPQSRVLRRHIFDDNFSWQRGSHRMRFGGEWEYQQGTGTYAYADPATMTLYSPDIVRFLWNTVVPAPLQISIPSSFNTLQDILQLPVAGFASGVGDINQPPTYMRGNADHNNRFHLYWQDTWRVNSRLTLNYGLGWSYESNLLNHDLTKPQYLAPIFGANGLGREQHTPANFSPMFGFAWKATKDGKTVVRGGGGIYYDTYNIEKRLIERAMIGPLGTGRVLLGDNVFFPTIAQLFNFAALYPGPLALNSLSVHPTIFTGAALANLLPQLRGGAAQQLRQNPNNTDLSIRNIEVFKTGTELLPQNFRLPVADHLSIGAQREIRQNLVVTADFVFRKFTYGDIRDTDLNHFNSLRGPVIPRCTSAAQAGNPAAQCSNGNIESFISGANSHYLGLLLKVDKRFSHRYAFTASYSFASREGYNDPPSGSSASVINQDNWRASYGPQQGHQILSLSGRVELPWGFEVSAISSFASRGPFQPVIQNVDLDGNGANTQPIPGGGYNHFGIDLGKSDLVSLVSQFNQTYGGKTTGRGQRIPVISLPANFDFGRNFNSQDLRVKKTFKLRSERYKLSILGEVFNLFNYANKSGYSNTLSSDPNSGFGSPTQRFANIFGSGGPRAFQLAARFTF